LRALKIQQNNTNELFASVPRTLEVAFLPPINAADDGVTPEEEDDEDQYTQSSSKKEGLKNKFFPGIFLASSVSRFIRPVRNLEVGGTEWIGPLEQVNMSIAC
jgi:hypothetical protein